MGFYKKVKEELAKNGLSMQTLCNETGINKSQISRCINQDMTPRAPSKKKICDFFGVPLDYFDDPEPEKNVCKVPVYVRVAAGIPIEAVEYIEGYEEIPARIATQGSFFGLKIFGQSMEPRMRENDIVIARSQDDVESGDVAIVLVSGELATCKQVFKTADGIRLHSFNPSFGDMNFSQDQIKSYPIKILGKVIELRARF